MQTVDIGNGVKLELHPENPFRGEPAKIVALCDGQIVTTIIANSALKQGHGDEAGYCVDFKVEPAQAKLAG